MMRRIVILCRLPLGNGQKGKKNRPLVKAEQSVD